jgi:hypothetical protein
VAEWLRSGLQSRLHRFDSGRRLALTAYTAAEWSDLFVAAAGASAALAGLVFVAVSINLQRILALPGLPERALETLMLLFGVTVVSLLGLIPGQSETALGLELLVQSIIWIAVIVPLVVKTLPGPDDPRGWYVSRIGLVAPALVSFAVGGISVLAGSGGGLYWTAAGIVAALVAGVANAWVLLVEIQR